MKRDDDGDLLAEARRRPLSREEEERLEELVERSPEARIMHYAGWAFDRDSSAREGDDVLVARLAARAAERSARPASTLQLRRRKRPLVLLIAAALGVAGTAGAGAGVVYFVRAPERAPETAPAAPIPTADPAKAPARRRASAPRLATPAPTPDPETAPAPHPETEPDPVAAPTPAPARPSPRSPSPATSNAPAADALGPQALFGEANRKRLAGDMAGAIVLYELLAERHPGSAEANLAELSLGKLFLSSGDAAGALRHFRQARASGGALAAEALWGEASALKALGRASEERAALTRLLSEYPDGAYAKAARKRLGTDAP